MKVILLGAPASGKGTLTGFIKKEFNAAHISTGDMFREAISKGTPFESHHFPLSILFSRSLR